MNSILKSLAVVALPVAFLVSASTSSTAQETKSKKEVKQYSPVGTWTWERKSGDSSIKSQVTIVAKKGKFTGKFKDPNRDLEIKNSKLEDGTFTFEVFPHPESPDLAITFSGNVSADSIKGKMSYTVNDESKSIPWKAKRTVLYDAVVGKWLLEFETPDGGEVSFKMQVKKKGTGLGVTFLDDETVAVHNVKFKDGVLKFDTEQDYQNQPISVEWDLKIDGNQVSGTLFYMFSEADEEGELDVTGERVK